MLTQETDSCISRRRGLLLLVAVMCVATLPFLGLADFNTKGEPREAVVAYSMLAQDNWILPVNNGGEIPYKPPFFHWCVALCALLTGGEVTEYVSRLPSALALIAMTSVTYVFVARRRPVGEALLTAAVTFTSFEVYRAGMNCRVDMMLAALTVGALVSLFHWWTRGMRRLPWLAILLMSCATLTKGPVGIIIPCLAAGLFMLVRGARFVPLFVKLVVAGLLSLLLPLAWYAAAYGQGGRPFLDLVMEENFGRMTGTMAYESHLNPWYYNILTLLSGFLPWTIAGVTALFVVRWRALRRHIKGLDGYRPATLGHMGSFFSESDSVAVFSLVASLVIFVFYCLPASKRSVYLLPMYPFTAYCVARVLMWMTRRRRGSVLGLGDGLAALGMLLFVVFAAIRLGLVPASMVGHGRHAAANAAMLESLRTSGGIMSWICAPVPVGAGLYWFCALRGRLLRARGSLKSGGRACVSMRAAVPMAVSGIMVALYIAFSGAYQPAVLNARSLKPMAAEIKPYPGFSENVYEFIEMAEEAKGNPIHYFELDFYLGDPVRNFRRERPERGYLLTGADDAAVWFPRFEEDGYVFELVRAPGAEQPRHTPSVYRFVRSVLPVATGELQDGMNMD